MMVNAGTAEWRALLILAPLCTAAAPMHGTHPRSASESIRPEPYLDASHWAFRGRIKGQAALFMMDTGDGITAISPQVGNRL